MPMMGGGMGSGINYPRYNGPHFPHRSITPLLGGLLVLNALDNISYFFYPYDPLYSYYYGLWSNPYGGGYGGGFGNPQGGYGVWSPWSPGFSLLGWLFGGRGRRRRR